MKVSSSHFTKDVEGKYLVTEASDLSGYGYRGGDALTLVSDFGHTADFFLVKTKIDEEGDYVCWEYAPSSESVDKIPQLKGWSLTVYND